MSDLRIVQVGEEHWQALKAERLRALEEAPYAFGSTLARESCFPDEEWQRRAGEGGCLLAFSDDRAVGMAAAVRELEAPENPLLVGMWVAPEARGTVVATELVEAVCRRAGAEGARLVALWVADGNPRARRFYERLGFASTGQRAAMRADDPAGEQKERMVRPL